MSILFKGIIYFSLNFQQTRVSHDCPTKGSSPWEKSVKLGGGGPLWAILSSHPMPTYHCLRKKISAISSVFYHGKVFPLLEGLETLFFGQIWIELTCNPWCTLQVRKLHQGCQLKVKISPLSAMVSIIN